MPGDDTVLRTLLQLREGSRFSVEPGRRSGQPYVLVRCPAGLSFVASDAAALEGLATAVMDARAQLLTAAGQVYRCRDDTPDPLQRRYNGLGLGWRDPIEEEPDRPRATDEPPVERIVLSADGPMWVSADETAAALGVSLATLNEHRVRLGLHRHRSGGQFVYRRADVIVACQNRRSA